ncbi:MAG: cytochrome b [Proteobacteria bacterium]|nr:cytochrome b [Pseudomonadota bacterium]
MRGNVRQIMASVPEAVPQERLLRYNNGAVLLHWLTALIVVTQVIVGFTFANMERGPARGDVFTLHKTLGATILVLALIRLGWRIAHPPPPYPPELPRWERVSGVWTHRAFYFLLIALPLTGLIAVSGGAGAEGKTTTSLLGGIALPLIPGISEEAGDTSGDVHILLVLITLALLVLHIAAALKHQFQHNRAAGRMPPFKTPGETAIPAS